MARSSAALRLSDLTPLAKVLVRASPDSAGTGPVEHRFGRAHRYRDKHLIVGTGPGEWLVLGPPGAADEMSAWLSSDLYPEAEVVLDVSHGGVLLRLTGAEAHRVLEKLCAIDLGDSVTGDGTCFRSRVAGVVCDVVREDLAGVRSYVVHGERSVGQYLFDALCDAGVEFGIETDGYTDLGVVP